jgi:hypothetical protein
LSTALGWFILGASCRHASIASASGFSQLNGCSIWPRSAHPAGAQVKWQGRVCCGASRSGGR